MGKGKNGFVMGAAGAMGDLIGGAFAPVPRPASGLGLAIDQLEPALSQAKPRRTPAA